MWKFEDWGLIEYQEALDKQLQKLEEVKAGNLSGILVFCTHPAVVTLGRKTQPQDVFGWKGVTVEVSRGGRATYHGPSQLVVYPIINLQNDTKFRKAHDIHGYLRDFEDAIVKTLKKYGIEAVGKTYQQKNTEEIAQEETGVWVGNKKIASLGIGVKSWIAYHGAAINLDHDSEAFQGMRPCGFDSDVMISVEKIKGEKINRDQFKKDLLKSLSEYGLGS